MHHRHKTYLQSMCFASFVLMPFVAQTTAAQMLNLSVKSNEAAVGISVQEHDNSNNDKLDNSQFDNDKLDEVGQSVSWQRLLLFKEGKSDIDNPAFFLSAVSDGQVDPKAELVATLKAWQAGDKRICNFVARTYFLKQALVLDDDLPDCPDFRVWADRLDIAALSLVYADEHPNHLASGFGHTLMRIDDTQGRHPTAINYTPNFNNDTSAKAAVGSVIGKYAGVMEILPFEQKRQDYNVKDERDIWQYTLALSQHELEQIVRHIWEVKDMTRPYYLMSDNCSTEILRLIDVVRADANLLEQANKIVTPVHAVQLLSQAQLIEKTQFLPSDASIRQAYQNNNNIYINDLTSQGNPVSASPLQRFGVSWVSDKQSGDGVVVSFRPAYRDNLDPQVGIRQYLDTQIMNTELIYNKDHKSLKLNRLDVINHRSYNPVNTQKSYNGVATGLQFGLRQAIDGTHDEYHDHLVAHASLEKGYAWTMGQGQLGSSDLSDRLCYIMGSAAAQAGHIAKGQRLGLGATVGCLNQMAKNFRLQAEFKLPYWVHIGSNNSESYSMPSATIGLQYDVSHHQALRLETSHQWLNGGDNTSLKFGYYRYF